MRKSVLSAVAMLLGACSSLSPPPAPAPEPVAARAEPPQVEAPPQRSVAPPTPAPQRPREIRIDNDSIEAFRNSWTQLRATLSPAERAALDQAVSRLAFVRYGGGTSLPANLRNNPIVPELIRDRIAGLSYAEIIALAP